MLGVVKGCEEARMAGYREKGKQTNNCCMNKFVIHKRKFSTALAAGGR
jgi:hypothetical protein